MENPNIELNWGISLTLVRGVLEIDERAISNLHPDLRVGLFATPGRYDAVARINVTDNGGARMSIRAAVPEQMEFLEECVAPPVDGFREIDFLLLAENIKTFGLRCSQHQLWIASRDQ